LQRSHCALDGVLKPLLGSAGYNPAYCGQKIALTPDFIILDIN
jgi:hypothetical protein